MTSANNACYFSMSNTIQVPMTTPDSIDDQLVISQLPAGIKKDLGAQLPGSGFNLLTSKRDLDFKNGYVVYQLSSDHIQVVLE